MSSTRFGAAVVVAALLACAVTLRADVKADEKTLVKFEGMLGRVVDSGSLPRQGVGGTS